MLPTFSLLLTITVGLIRQSSTGSSFAVAANALAGPVTNDVFSGAFNRIVLDRILQGKAVKVQVEDTRKVAFEQDAVCSSCGANGNGPDGHQNNYTNNGTVSPPSANFQIISTVPEDSVYTNDGVAVACSHRVNTPLPGLNLTVCLSILSELSVGY